MSKTRQYEFQWNLPDDTPCFIVASISGSDWPGNHIDPPEYREVEIGVYTPLPDKFGTPLNDVTEEQSEEFLDAMREKAMEIEDNRFADAMEAHHDMLADREREERI